MTIAWVASATANNGATPGTDIPFGIPAGASVGDLCLVAFINNSSADTVVTVPLNFVALDTPRVGGTALTGFCYGKILEAGDPGATATFVMSGSGRNCGVLDVFSGADIDAAIGAATSALAGTGDAPAVTSTVLNAWIWNAWMCNPGVVTAATITVPGSHTALGYAATGNGSGANMSARAGRLTAASGAAGAKGPYTATFGTTARDAAFSVAIKPLAAPAPPTAGDLIIDRS